MIVLWIVLVLQWNYKVLATDPAADALFDEYWQMHLRDHPEIATSLGDHRYDNRLDDFSLQGFENRKVKMTEFLERANQLLLQAADESDTQDNLQRFAVMLRYQISRITAGSHLFPVTFLDQPHMELLYLQDSIKLKHTKDYMVFLSRYRAFPQQIYQKMQLMRKGIQTHFTLNERSLWKLSSAEKNQVATESPFFTPFLNISLPPNEAENARHIYNSAVYAVENSIFYALSKLDNFTKEEYIPNTRAEIGVSSLPGGRDFYQSELSFYLTDSTVTAEEIHAMGEAEVLRIAKEMDEVIHSLGLTVTRQEFNNQLRSNTSQFFGTEEEAVEAYKDVIQNKIKPKLPLFFKNIPRKELTVQKVPSEMAGGPKAYYVPSSPDSPAPATFYVDTSTLKNLPKFEVATVALHEGIPGHHLQISYSMEQKDLPEFRKSGVQSNAYAEGWGLYSEYLGYELGLYKDPYQRYGHLSEEIFRACRLVVDTGMHVLGWSRQKAIDYMLTYSASSLGNIEREVDRYITWPGQACSYKYGELKIKGLRKKAETELGADFDLKEFHDVILRSNGPLEIVEKQVNHYIDFCKMNSDNCSKITKTTVNYG